MKVYALYKGEEILAIGTIKELSDKFDVKRKTLLFYQTPVNKKRDKGNRRVLVKIEWQLNREFSNYSNY